jgi:hypothetical protein
MCLCDYACACVRAAVASDSGTVSTINLHRPGWIVLPRLSLLSASLLRADEGRYPAVYSFVVPSCFCSAFRAVLLCGCIPACILPLVQPLVSAVLLHELYTKAVIRGFCCCWLPMGLSAADRRSWLILDVISEAENTGKKAV